MKKKNYFIKIKPKHAKWPPSDLTPWTLTLAWTDKLALCVPCPWFNLSIWLFFLPKTLVFRPKARV